MELRRALQISNGDLSGLIEPFSIVVYVIVGLVLLWPIVRKLLPRKAVPEVLAEAAHEIEESHHQHGLTSAVSVERHAPRSALAPRSARPRGPFPHRATGGTRPCRRTAPNGPA